ncbi:MAG: efflux RND transporter permease subunit, partial [Planctomycetia bacterium]|nr:efflux RND transporter permease subunit [Planctomycetia bacterium]
LVSRGWIKQPSTDQQVELANDATMFALETFDQTLRNMTFQDYASFNHQLAPALTRSAVEELVRLLGAGGKLKRVVANDELTALVTAVSVEFGPRLVEAPDVPTIEGLIRRVSQQLAQLGIIDASPDLLRLNPSPLERFVRDAGEVLGVERPTFFSTVLAKVEARRDELWLQHVKELNWRLFDHAVPFYTWQATEQLQKKAELMSLWDGPHGWQGRPTDEEVPAERPSNIRGSALPSVGDTSAEFASLRSDLEASFADRLFLWQKDKDGLLKEMDSVAQVPGWGNIWTQPIINRIDMLATGVRTMIGVKVYGDDLNKIQQVSEQIAAALREVPGAADVFPDQIVGEGYLEINIDRDKAARYGVNVGDVQDVVEVALGGKMVTMTVEGRERFPVRVRYARAFREDEESVKNLLISAGGSMAASGGPDSMSAGGNGGIAGDNPTLGNALTTDRKSALDSFPDGVTQIPLAQIADVRIVEGPSMIKSENGLLRSYVQLNVRDRDIVGFVEEAQRAVADKVKLPAGMYIEWSGQFEHQVRAKRTLTVIVPIVVLIIFVLLYVTYHDLVDALLMMLAVPGAVAGGVLFQYLFGFNFSVAVWVGFIACFGLATETGVVMLVYLREAVADRGGLENIGSLAELRQAIMDGAVHRLRPKLLTEGTTIIGLAPMLWATGTGAEIMQPMAAPVLGGILVADEVIDLLLPALFYQVRVWRWRRIHAARQSNSHETPSEST